MNHPFNFKRSGPEFSYLLTVLDTNSLLIIVQVQHA